MESDRVGAEFEHEQVTVFRDPATRLTGVIAIHSTALGPAMGGLRLCSYAGLESAILDAMRLARAMSLKNAAADLDLGGGKAVLVDDGRWSEDRGARMRAAGRAVEALGGRYITAEDVGTTATDMDAIATVTAHVAGRSPEQGGRGDPSPFTARTVFGAIESAVRLRLGVGDLAGVRVGVQGVGHVGEALVGLLRAAGAIVSVTDIDPQRARAVAAAHAAVPVPLRDFISRPFDVLAPCALGGAIAADDVEGIRAAVVAGAANNPLADPSVASLLAARDILYVPDFIANCGGIIHVGAEALQLGPERGEALLEDALARTDRLLAAALAAGRVPLDVAEEFAEERIRRASERRGDRRADDSTAQPTGPPPGERARAVETGAMSVEPAVAVLPGTDDPP